MSVIVNVYFKFPRKHNDETNVVIFLYLVAYTLIRLIFLLVKWNKVPIYKSD